MSCNETNDTNHAFGFISFNYRGTVIFFMKNSIRLEFDNHGVVKRTITRRTPK